jgi:hypothetical protein
VVFFKTNTMKEALIFTYELLKFTLISIPLACLIYLIAVSLCGFKKLIK